MLTFVFIYGLKNMVNVSYANNVHCKIAHVFWNGWSI